MQHRPGPRPGPGPRPRAFAAGLTLAALLTLPGCDGTFGTFDACPAVGYAYIGPVELQVPGQSPTTAEVLACFGEECTPTEAEASGEAWALDIATSVNTGGSLDPTAVTAIVTEVESGRELARGVFPITYRRTDGGGRCPGPTAPDPVVIASH